MKFPKIKILVPLAALFLITNCANPHFFPRTRPLFVGFDETHVPASKKEALEFAKVDFQRARRGDIPMHAKFEAKLPNSRSKTYRGDGYQITMVNNERFGSRKLGPEIILEPAITGGESFQYEEVDDITY
jgi:hypothetical protein